MRKYSDLTQPQKDRAADKALYILIEKLMWDGFDYQFKSVLAQKHFYEAFSGRRNDEQVRAAILDSDEIAEELYPIATSMAEAAYYPEIDDYVIEGVAK